MRLSLWAVLPFLLVGCTRATPPPTSASSLTPTAFQLLSDNEKVRLQTTIVRVPASWGGALLPVDRGPFASPTEKAVHSGDLATLAGLYNQSLFELSHPGVKLEYIHFDMWSDNFRSALAVALSAGRAPAYYIARDLPQTIEQGMYADITPLVKKWDQAKLQPEGTVREGTVEGHHFVIAANELGASVIRYRKDWFREAGIFNEHGEPGPRSDWTWDDFRAIAKKLTDPKRGRFGFAAELGDFQYNQAVGLDYYIPDPTGKHTWTFNADDPQLLRSLQNARAMLNDDKSVSTSVSTGWFEWHAEFDASHAAMIPSFSPHIARESLENPGKFGKDKPYDQTVGMIPPPHGPAGYSGLKAICNPIGFDPTLSPAQLEAAFDWCREWFYGEVAMNRMRAAAQEAKIKGKQSTLYAELLYLPYTPKENLLDKPFEAVFPRDYLDTYKTIRASHAPPLPREFGLKEPATNELNKAIKAMYSEALTSKVELKALIARTAHLVNTNLLSFGGPQDRERLEKYLAARDAFYKTYYPAYYEQVWKPQRATRYRVPQ